MSVIGDKTPVLISKLHDFKIGKKTFSICISSQVSFSFFLLCSAESPPLGWKEILEKSLREKDHHDCQIIDQGDDQICLIN